MWPTWWWLFLSGGIPTDSMLYPSREQLLGGIMFAHDIHSMPWHFQDRTSTKTHVVFTSNEFGLIVACLILNQHCQHTFPTVTKNLWQTFRPPFYTPNGQTCSSCTPSQFRTAHPSSEPPSWRFDSPLSPLLDESTPIPPIMDNATALDLVTFLSWKFPRFPPSLQHHVIFHFPSGWTIDLTLHIENDIL